ncbi:SDR family oxidoreductase [Streptomyces sp. BE20]|uniref:SDR family oxidoreductase n=1 Tax=Streptomyces sp. BE20 TaxID=3002525 RepID=UPI003FA7D48B
MIPRSFTGRATADKEQRQGRGLVGARGPASARARPAPGTRPTSSPAPPPNPARRPHPVTRPRSRTARYRGNEVSLGYIEADLLTECSDREPPKARQAATDTHILGRLGKPHDIAALVAILLSHVDCFVTGADRAVDGGAFARFASWDLAES